MKTILHTVDIGAAPEAVYQAIATEAGLSGWWTATVEAEERVGSVIDFRFGATFNPDMKITALESPRLITWTCVGGHEPWMDNHFRFEIEPRGDGCALFFTQEYAQELSDEEYGRYNYNWGYYLESLRRLVETGRGTPFNASSSRS